MNSNEFNNKYKLNPSLTQALVRHNNSSNSGNNIAGKPKKLINEIFKRFCTNWLAVVLLILFITILLISIIVNATSLFPENSTIEKNIFINIVDENGKIINTLSGTSAVKNLSPSIYSWDSQYISIERSHLSAAEFNKLVGTLEKNEPGFKQLLAILNQNLAYSDPSKHLSSNLVNFMGPNGSGIVKFVTEGEDTKILINPNSYAAFDSLLITVKNQSKLLKTMNNDQIIDWMTKTLQANNNFKIDTILGTDNVGIDIWTSSWIGTWKAIRLAIIVATIQTFIGVAVGSYLGFHAGSLIDTIIMRLIEIFSAPPSLIWLLTFVSVFGTSDLVLGFSLIFTGWTGSVGGARMYIITVKDEEYITASKSIGAKKPRLIYSHALPAIIGKIATSFVSAIPSIILSVSSLAFLGFFQGNEANLGSILSNAVSKAGENVWILLLPSLILLGISVSLYFIALGVHDALDPKVIKGKS